MICLNARQPYQWRTGQEPVPYYDIDGQAEHAQFASYYHLITDGPQGECNGNAGGPSPDAVIEGDMECRRKEQC